LLIPDVTEILRRMERRGLTHKDLASEFFKKFKERWRRDPKAGEGLSQRVLGKALAAKPCTEVTLKNIAWALDCNGSPCMVEDIVLGPNRLRWAMMDEIFTYANGGLGETGGIFFRLLLALEGGYDEKVNELARLSHI